MNPFSVVIAGGGVAALEALLRLRRIAGDGVAVTLLCPGEEFSVAALSVGQPFSHGAPPRHPVRRIADETGAEWVRDELAWVDAGGQAVHTAGGRTIAFDALLIAVGGTPVEPFEHVTTFRPQSADETFRGIVQDLEQGFARKIAFLAPAGPSWPLPLYELALQTAERAAASGITDAELTVVTPEARPVAAFGDVASSAVEGVLHEAGIRLEAGTAVRVPAARTLELEPSGEVLHPDRMISVPRITGPSIRGLRGGGADGFIPIDDHCRVKNAGGRIFAAGDATSFPVKHGGLAAQMGDAAAEGIARLAGLNVSLSPLRGLIRGRLETGGDPLYLSACLVGGHSFDSTAADQPAWALDTKVVAPELSRHLAGEAALR